MDKIIWNPYKPTDPDFEYPDVVRQERTEKLDSLRPSKEQIYLDVFESMMPQECPIHYVPDVHLSTGETVRVIRDVELYQWIGWQQNTIESKLPDYVRQWYERIEQKFWKAFNEGKWEYSDQSMRIDDAISEMCKEKWNLEW